MIQRIVSRAIFLFIAVCGGLAACQSRQIQFTEEETIPISRIESPNGDYYDVAWVTDEWLIVGYEPHPEHPGSASQLWQMRIDGSELQKLDLPTDEQHTCLASFFASPVVISPGVFVFERECTTRQDPHVRLLMDDIHTSSSELLYPYELPFGAARFTFAPDMSRGVLSSNTGIEDRLYWLGNHSYVQIELRMDRASSPAWSPDGASIAFFGRKDLPGSPGPDWATKPDDLWLMPANCDASSAGCASSLVLVLSNLRDPRRASWSPDAQWLAFDGDLDNNGWGIWVLNVATQTVYRIAKGWFGLPDWSPDGKRLIVTAPSEPVGATDYPAYQPALYIIDLDNFLTRFNSK